MRPVRYLSNPEIAAVDGAVVVVDVLRAFTTAAYAFGAGATGIYLVSGAEEALALKASLPGSLAVGEVGGLMPGGFDLPNSPVRAAEADVAQRTLVLRTSAGTQGVVQAQAADRLWCASLVCASATAAAVEQAGLGIPAYVITGRFANRADHTGADDLLAAQHIEAIRAGLQPDPQVVAQAVASSEEAVRTLLLGADHVDPLDVAYAVDVDRFDFSMEVTRDDVGLRLDRIEPSS